MSSINGINGNGWDLNQLGSYNPISQQGSNSDNDGQRGGKVGKGGLFANALVQALSQIGVTAVPPAANASSGDASSSSTSTASASGTTTPTTQDPQQALAAFLHDLFAALHSTGNGQGGQPNAATTTGATDSDGDNDGSVASAASGAVGNGHHHHGGGAGAIENKLQSLIQQLSSTSSTATAPSSGTSTSPLQQDFQNLLSSLGAGGNQSSLPDFLKAIAENLKTNGTSQGLNVSTVA